MANNLCGKIFKNSKKKRKKGRIVPYINYVEMKEVQRIKACKSKMPKEKSVRARRKAAIKITITMTLV